MIAVSYNVYLCDGGKSVIVQDESHKVASHESGLAELEIPHENARYFWGAFGQERGIRYLYGKRAIDTIPLLERAIEILGTEQDDNPWKGTPGNAGYTLSILLGWARRFPNAVWEGD